LRFITKGEKMKDKIKKIITFIGFTVVIIAAIMLGLEGVNTSLMSVALPSVFAICFIFANNSTLKNFGYAISAVNLAVGVASLESDETMILAVGLIVMSLASVLYFIEIVFGFFGYVLNRSKGRAKCNTAFDDFGEIEKYAQMYAEGILNEEEYTSLKAKVLSIETSNKTSSSIDDLKKWKKLFDKKLISDEEYSSIKTKILK
jgi:hypothetical protein